MTKAAELPGSFRRTMQLTRRDVADYPPYSIVLSIEEKNNDTR